MAHTRFAFAYRCGAECCKKGPPTMNSYVCVLCLLFLTTRENIIYVCVLPVGDINNEHATALAQARNNRDSPPRYHETISCRDNHG